MTRTAAEDIVRHIAQRMPGIGLIDRKTGLPYGLSLWLRTVADRQGPPRATVAPQALVDVLLDRPPPPPATRRLHRDAGWRAFAALFRQQWDPPPADERPLRRRAVFVTVCVHLFYAAALLWLALVRLVPPLPDDDEGSRTRVEFVGSGTPDAQGGGAPGGEASARADGRTASAATEAAARPTRAAATPAAAADASARAAEPSAAAAAQPVQVSEASPAPADYVLPPTAMALPAPVLPEVVAPEARLPAVRETEVTVVDVQPLAVTRPEPRLEVPVRESGRLPQVRQREVTVVERPDIPQAEVRLPEAAPALRTRPSDVVQREVAVQVREAQPAPAKSPAATPPPSAPAQSAASASSTTAATAARVPAASASAPAAGRSSAPVTAAADGWAKTPQRADDWGAAARNRPGSADGARAGRDGAGLFDRDGRARLPGEAGTAPAARGAPGGDADRWTRERLDSAGTWLKRPPYDYDPTSFDKYWVPNESLLEEWVRRGIKDISIPIPGTGKRLRCVVSLLQLGGGCGIGDPNLNDQPAVARPPPDIPFKPGLQEDNGSVRPGQAPGRP